MPPKEMAEAQIRGPAYPLAIVNDRVDKRDEDTVVDDAGLSTYLDTLPTIPDTDEDFASLSDVDNKEGEKQADEDTAPGLSEYFSDLRKLNATGPSIEKREEGNVNDDNAGLSTYLDTLSTIPDADKGIATLNDAPASTDADAVFTVDDLPPKVDDIVKTSDNTTTTELTHFFDEPSTTPLSPSPAPSTSPSSCCYKPPAPSPPSETRATSTPSTCPGTPTSTPRTALSCPAAPS